MDKLIRHIFLKDNYVFNYNQKNLMFFLFLGWFGLFIFFGIFSLPGFLFMVCTICFIGYVILYLASCSDLDVKFARDILKVIKFFIDSNNLAVFESDQQMYTDKRGNLKTRNKRILVYVPNINFSFDDSNLYFCIRNDGSKYSKNFGSLSDQLEGAFKIKFVSVNYDVKGGYWEYSFRRIDIERKNVSDIDIVKNSIVLSDTYVWDFVKNPHALITGVTGSGKTFLFAYFIVIFLRINASFRIVDPKRADLYYLNKYFGSNVVYEKNHALRILRESCEFIDERMENFQSREDFTWGKDYTFYKVQPFFIIFDEASAFVALLDKKSKDEYDRYIAKIILEGRQAGIFIIFSMQRADTGFLKGALRDQLGLRIALGNLSNDGYKMVFGDSGKDLSLSDSLAGFVKDLKIDVPEEFFTPYLDIDFIKEIEKLINYEKK